MKVQAATSIGSACRHPRRFLLVLLVGGAVAIVMAGAAGPALGASGSAARAEASSLAGWKPVGQIMLIDVPTSSGVILDVNPFRPGVQTLAVVLHNRATGRVRVSTLLGRVLGEASDGGFVPAGTLGAGWRAFAWGKSGEVARVWTPTFDSALSLASVDPALPCVTAVDASTALAGPFNATIPQGTRPGGKSVPSPTTALVFGNPAGGVRIATAAGVTLGQKASGTTARGGFALAGAVFAYGTASSKPTLWTPALLGTSSQLVAAGFVGCVAAPPPFDGSATPILDEASAESATIGRAGGSLAAGGVTLTVPADALSEDAQVTMTPITDLAGSPLQGSLIGAVKLEPDGLLFLKPALLTMALPAGVSPADVLGFGSATDGSDLHLVPRTVAGGAISVDVWHFSTGGASSGGATAAAAMQSHQPSTAEQQARQRIAAAEAACVAEEAQGVQNGPACTNLEPEIVRAYFDWYVNAVRPGLEQAAGAPSFQVEAALAEWLYWVGALQAQFLGSSPVCANLQSECDQALALATAAVADMARRRLQNCTGTDLVSQIRDVIRVTDFAVAGQIDLTTAPGEPRLPDAGGGGLVRKCVSIQIDPPTFPKVAARNRANALGVHAYLGTASGARLASVPLELSINVLRGFSNASGGPLDNQGRFETTVTPTGAVSVTVDITVELAAGALPQIPPGVYRESITSTDQLTPNVRDRVELEPLAGAPTTVDPGDSVPLKVKVAGDDMGGASVTYTVSGPGSLSSTSGTTNADGEALTFDYSAPPPGSPGGSATITAAFGDASDSLTITVTAPVSVSISPAAAALNPGGTSQFTATVTGTTNTAVDWTATGGTISQTGLYTAGSTTGTFSVTARSVADPTKSAFATVTISGGSAFFAGTVTYDENIPSGGATITNRISVSAFVRVFVGQDGRITLVEAQGSGSRTLVQTYTCRTGTQHTISTNVSWTVTAGHSRYIMGGSLGDLLDLSGPGTRTVVQVFEPACQPVTSTEDKVFGVTLSRVRRVFESGRLVAIDLDYEDGPITQRGRLEPVP